MSIIGSLAVRIGADTADLRRGLNRARGEVDRFRTSITPTIKAVAAVAAAAAVVCCATAAAAAASAARLCLAACGTLAVKVFLLPLPASSSSSGMPDSQGRL